MKKAAAFLAFLFMASIANGAILFTETFAGSVPDPGGNPYGVGALPGTQFTVTSYNVDIIGVLNGSFFTCVQNPTGNCLDLIGTEGGGSIQSVPTFSLIAGDVYTLTFEADLQSFTGTTPTTTFDVSLGTLTQTETADGNGASYTLTFTPTANQAGAELAFTTVSGPNPYNGAVLDDIMLTGPSTSTPEPVMTGMLLVSLGGLVIWKRRRVHQASFWRG